jgi:hypothetical protein
MRADMLRECSIRLQGASTLREGAEQRKRVWVHAMRTSDLLSARDRHGEAMLGGPRLRGDAGGDQSCEASQQMEGTQLGRKTIGAVNARQIELGDHTA